MYIRNSLSNKNIKILIKLNPDAATPKSQDRLKRLLPDGNADMGGSPGDVSEEPVT